MSGVNKVILIGNLGKDPEIKYLESKVPVAKFPLATTETWKGRDGEKKEHTEWHNIVLWRGLAEISEKYLQKGDRVYIEGRLRTRTWDDKDGNKRYATEVIADNMNMLTTGKSRVEAADTGKSVESEEKNTFHLKEHIGEEEVKTGSESTTAVKEVAPETNEEETVNEHEEADSTPGHNTELPQPVKNGHSRIADTEAEEEPAKENNVAENTIKSTENDDSDLPF